MSEVRFTASQLAAIGLDQRHRDGCIVAGPGSGKTTVLVEYFRRLVAAGADPLRILAITFTEKAAGNMRSKLAEAFRDDLSIRAALERAWVSTVHGFCARLLRENAVFAGVDPEFAVADARDSWRMQQESMAAAMDALFEERPADVRALVRGLSSMDFEEAVLNAYDAMRGAGVTIEQIAAKPAPEGVSVAELAASLDELRHQPLTGWKYEQKQHFQAALDAADRILAAAGPAEALAAIAAFPRTLNKCKQGTAAYNLLKQMRDQQIDQAPYSLITELYAAERRLLLEIFRRFDRIYRQRKRQAGALDFADLEEFSVALLERHPDTRARLQGQFDHVLMDEFQDTNGQQARLLELIRAPGRFYAVGDVNQSIFGFRHAEPEGFERYREAVEGAGGRHVELRENFRSRPEILRAVETIVGSEEGIVPHRLIAARRFDAPRPLPVELTCVAAGEDEEAQWVARRIQELRGEFSYREMAVLVRNTEVLGAFAAAFEQAGIPYLVDRGRGFYDAREVVDLTHLLRVMANPRDEISLAAVLRSPLVGVSDEAILALRVLAREPGGGPDAAAAPERPHAVNIGEALRRLAPEYADGFAAADFDALSRFQARLHGWRIRREAVAFDRLLLAAIDDCGYRGDAPRAEANIDKFLAMARDAAARTSLDEFVEELALVRADNPREPDAPPEDCANAVKVMTVHSAKGLEFPVVFLAALHKGIDDDPPVVAFSRAHGLGARWRNPATRKEKDDLFQHAIRQELALRELHESHRLLYVAMTRAEQHLALSFSGKKPREWAEVVVRNLHLDCEIPREETLDYGDWKLRLRVTDRGPELSALPVPAVAEMAPVSAPDLLPPPTVTGQYDTSATVTALSAFAACPRKYYLGGYLGFEAANGSGPGNGGISAAALGSQVHQLLAGTPATEATPEAARLAAVFGESPLGRRAAAAARSEREFDFVLALEDLVIRGQVDLWFEEAGGIVIVDYKTDAVKPAEAHQRAGDYALQLRIYALAVERVTGRPATRAYLHFLRPNTMVEVDLTPSLLDSPEQMVRDFQAAQETLDFPLHEGPQCRRCSFFHNLCPARG